MVSVAAWAAAALASTIEKSSAQSNQTAPTLVLPKQFDSVSKEQFRALTNDLEKSGSVQLHFETAPMLDDATLSALPPLVHFPVARLGFEHVAPLIDVFLAPQAQVQALADSIASRVARETPDNRSVLNDLQKQFQEKRTPTLTVSPARLTYVAHVDADNKQITQAQGPGYASTLNVNQTIAARVLFANTLGIEFGVSSLQFLPAKERLSSVASRAPALAPLAKAYSNVFDSIVSILQSPADEAEKDNLIANAKKYRDDYFDTWPKIKDNPAARSAAANAYNGLARQGELKAIYGISTNFPPPSYQQIYNFSRRVVAIRAGAEKICSGLAIDQTWIATAGHCFQNRAWSDMRVVFDLDPRATKSKVVAIVDIWPNPPPGASDKDDIDFAFVRVTSDPEVSSYFDNLVQEEKQEREPAEPLCIRTTPLTYREPVFAIGYPRGGDKTVHDYSYVWFPFKLSQADFNQLDADTYARARRIGDQNSDPKYADEVIDSFRKAYGKTSAQGTEVYHYYYGRAVNTADRPSFGVDTDTFGGDSGAPVFDRRNRCLVGIFTGGARDALIAPEVSWQQHEFATPITEVLDHIAKSNPRVANADQTSITARESLVSRISQIKDIR